MNFNAKILLFSSLLLTSNVVLAQQSVTYTPYVPKYDGYDSYYQNGTTYYYSDQNSTITITDKVPVYPKKKYYYYYTPPEKPHNPHKPHKKPDRDGIYYKSNNNGDGIYIRNWLYFASSCYIILRISRGHN